MPLDVWGEACAAKEESRMFESCIVEQLAFDAALAAGCAFDEERSARFVDDFGVAAEQIDLRMSVHERLLDRDPVSCSSRVNRLMKFRYRLSAS